MTTLIFVLIVNLLVLVLLNFFGSEKNIESRTDREEKILRNRK